MRTHPIHLILRRDYAALVADAEEIVDWLDGITRLDDLVVGVTRDGRIRAWRDEETEADEIVLVDAADVLTAERTLYEIVTDLVEGALAAAREWRPLPIGLGFAFDVDEPVRYAHVLIDGQRLTLVWSTVERWCEWGRPDHLVLQPDPDVPPAIWSPGGSRWEAVPAQCGACGTMLTPDVKILRGWWPEERIRRYGHDEELLIAVEHRLYCERVRVERRLRLELAEARQRLEGVEPVTADMLRDALADSWARLGSDEEPGVYVADGRLVAWDYTQGLDGPEVVQVRQFMTGAVIMLVEQRAAIATTVGLLDEETREHLRIAWRAAGLPPLGLITDPVMLARADALVVEHLLGMMEEGCDE